MKIQHEDTGYVTTIPDNNPLPSRWIKVPDDFPEQRWKEEFLEKELRDKRLSHWKNFTGKDKLCRKN